MKKEIVQYLCDDCGKKVDQPYEFIIDEASIDFCEKCLISRIKISIKEIEIGNIQCKNCEGRGTVKDTAPYGYGENWEKCEKCKGSGRAVIETKFDKDVEMKLRCSNCNKNMLHLGDFYIIPKGETVDSYIKKAKCSTCKCQTLINPLKKK